MDTVSHFWKKHIPPVLLNTKVHDELAETPANMSYEFPLRTLVQTTVLSCSDQET